MLAIVLIGTGALAADSGFSFDGSLPDGSVEQGGPDQTQEMMDKSNGACSESRDCERGFVCSGGRCTYGGVRNASCSFGGPSAALLFPLVLVVRWRRRRSD